MYFTSSNSQLVCPELNQYLETATTTKFDRCFRFEAINADILLLNIVIAVDFPLCSYADLAVWSILIIYITCPEGLFGCIAYPWFEQNKYIKTRERSKMNVNQNLCTNCRRQLPIMSQSAKEMEEKLTKIERSTTSISFLTRVWFMT